MVKRRSARRNPYRPGSASYESQRRAELNRRRALAEATAERANRPETRREAKRRAANVRRSIRIIETHRAFRDQLNEHDRAVFNTLSIKEQQRVMAVVQAYPVSVPPDVPDPFGERPFRRGSIWRLYYATRAGIRRRA